MGLVFSAFGILISGLIISKYKPRARYLAAWNVIVGIISVMGIISYAFLGCAASDNTGARIAHGGYACSINTSLSLFRLLNIIPWRHHVLTTSSLNQLRIADHRLRPSGREARSRLAGSDPQWSIVPRELAQDRYHWKFLFLFCGI